MSSTYLTRSPTRERWPGTHESLMHTRLFRASWRHSMATTILNVESGTHFVAKNLADRLAVPLVCTCSGSCVS
eukprot:4213221-Prymnesium_polylepis.2